MDGFAFSLEQAVKVNLTGVKGEVIAIWVAKGSDVKYQVQYSTQTGEMHCYWFLDAEISAVTGG